MFFFTWILIGCSPDKGLSEDDSQTDENPVDSTGDAVNAIRPFCKQIAYTSSYNGEVVAETNYEWTGNTQEAPDWYAEFNAYGYMTKSQSISDGYISNSFVTYQCDGWCRVLSATYESGSSAENLDVIHTDYDWNGNIQTDELRTWTYNDMGYVIEAYDEGSGYESTTRYDYACNQYWCKLQSTSTQTLTAEGQMDEATDYTWEENTQTYENGYVVYNDYGYVLEQEMTYGDTVSLINFRYDCSTQ